MARTPLYRKVEGDLIARIQQMRVGEMIPPEPELEREFGVSRATVRRAVESLVADGLLEKRQGLGTIVRGRPETQDVGTVYSWTAEMRARSVPTTTSHLSIARQRPGRQVSKELGLARGEQVVVISRVRRVQDVPVVIMVNYLPERLVPGMVERGLTGESLYDELAEVYGIDLIAGEETIGARDATPAEASLLEVEEGASLLHVRRLTYARGNVPVEAVDMVARGDRYQYHANLAGGPVGRIRTHLGGDRRLP